MIARAPRLEQLSLEEWDRLEAETEVAHEYLDGWVYAMAGESDDHNDICVNLTETLGPKTRAKGCKLRVLTFRLFIPPLNRYYYPDIQISCAEEPSSRHFSQPCFVLEVLSPSTEEKDRREKLEAYVRLPSLQTYALVHQNRRQVELYERSGKRWFRHDVINDETFEVTCSGIEIGLNEVYAGLEIPRVMED